MKFLLLKTLLLRRAKDEGFTLPVVIAIGLIMILLSAVNLAKSSEENLNTLSQQGLSNAIAMAEVGIARYRELLDKNRVLAVYNLSEWTSNFVTSQVCDAIIASGKGWANNDNDGGGTAFNANMWRDIKLDDSDDPIGYFKIVNYIYDRDGDLTTDNNGEFSQLSDIDELQDENSDGVDDIPNDFDTARNNHNDVDNDGESDARGILTVKGRSLDGSEAQIQVEIPIGVNTQEMDNLSPALWIEQDNNNITSVGNNNTLTIGGGGNVVLYRPSGSGDCDNATITSLDGESTISDPRTLPPLIDIASIANVKPIESDMDTDPDFDRYDGYEDGDEALILGTDATNHDTAENTEPNVEGENETRYYYQTTSNYLDIDYGEKLLSDSKSKVLLYVDGNLNIGTTGGSGDITIGSASGDAASSRFLEIHVTGNVNIRGNGNIDIRALIHAPNGTVNITGSPIVTVNGSIWAENWNNTSGTVTITPDDYQYYRITRERTPSPITYRIEDWERQDVN